MSCGSAHAATLKTLATFAHNPVSEQFDNGGSPQAALLADSSGNLYGTAQLGGNYGSFGAGTVFELAKGGGLSTLVSFTGVNGDTPFGNLIADASGNLYGTTRSGGGPRADGQGTIFELHKGGSLEVLAVFNGGNGATPVGGLVADAAGNLFGTTLWGDRNYGTLFELTRAGTLTTLVTFNGGNGSNPYATLFQDGAGNLFGTTTGGGTYNQGTVFELAKSGGLTTLANFNGANGSRPFGGVTADISGNLFGTTTNGGDNDAGTVFEIPHGGQLKTLASFNSSNSFPNAGVILDAKGNIFGTTMGSGSVSDHGTVFELVKGGGLVTLVSFNDSNGTNPAAGLIADASGNLFGTTEYGGYPGSGGAGTVFEVILDQPTPAPEPGTWILMLTGFGIVGEALRHRKTILPKSKAANRRKINR